MPTTHVRPFVRADRIGLTGLVNAHLAAVIPGASTSVQALLSHLESEPGEFIVDRWVTERRTLVAEQDGRIVAAAHLLRYGDEPEVGRSYRDAAEIAWLVCWPDAPFWAGSEEAGWAVLEAAVGQLTAWRASRWYADGSVPVPGAYGGAGCVAAHPGSVPTGRVLPRPGRGRAGLCGRRSAVPYAACLDDQSAARHERRALLGRAEREPVGLP